VINSLHLDYVANQQMHTDKICFIIN